MSATPELAIAQRRALLVEKRDRYLLLALDAAVEVIAISAQTHGVPAAERTAAIKKFQDKAANCNASAAEVEKLLNALPSDAPAKE